MFYYMLLNHYQSTTEAYNIFITTGIFYWLCFINVPVVYRFNILLGLIAIDIGLYVSFKPTNVQPTTNVKLTNVKRKRNKNKHKKVRFSDNIGYQYLPPVQKDFFPSYMTYGRKPEFKSEQQPLDNRHEYEEIMSQDNTSVLSSFASSFADSNSSNSL